MADHLQNLPGHAVSRSKPARRQRSWGSCSEGLDAMERTGEAAEWGTGACEQHGALARAGKSRVPCGLREDVPQRISECADRRQVLGDR